MKTVLGLSAVVSLFVLGVPQIAFATSGGEADHSVMHFGVMFAMLALLLVAGKIGSMVEKYGQPAVVGELMAGIALSAGAYAGISFFGDIRDSPIMSFIAQFGALLLLFSIGLESNIAEMKKVGARALFVALIGVIVPFCAGAFLLAPALFEGAGTTTQLFIGAALVATSVGVTASVFRSLGIEKTRAAKTVIGAAVIDDVLGLLVLAVVSAIAAGSEITAASFALMVVTSFGFLGAAIAIGSVVAKPLSRLFSRLHSGIGAKVTLAISLALVFGYLAELAGLEPIIGAFAAGLVLDGLHFESFADPTIVKDLKGVEFNNESDSKLVTDIIHKHRHAHIEDLVNNIGFIFVPVFFVFAGLQIDFGSLLKPELYLTAILISIVAILGKLVAGVAAQGTVREKLLVGASMVPRGEVGLVFATTGAGLGVLTADQFSVIVIVIILTTFLAPFAIKKLAEDNSTGELPRSRSGNLFKGILSRKHYSASSQEA